MATALINQNLPTNYEYYTSGGIQTGLSTDKPNFTLNGRNISIYSGAMHYFRVPRPYWRDRLRKMRAAGLNTVETYVPWNLHEPRSGEFDFGEGGNDMSDFLHLKEYINTAKEEDLFVIARPGPFICAEFEFGGFPSWLLREKDLEVRTSNTTFMKYVIRYFNVMLPLLAALQFINGGPIIMFQVENEYANSRKHDPGYVRMLRQQMIQHGIKELLVSADNPHRGKGGTAPGLFMTGTISRNLTTELDYLRHYQPNKPVMAMEFYPGWFDFWGNRHNTKAVEEFREEYEIFLKYPASINLYMFHGGTSFGFMNGAENLRFDDKNTDYRSIISSYDYDAPINEAGQYTQKYTVVRELLNKYNTVKTKLPDIPKTVEPIAYTWINTSHYMPFQKLLTTLNYTKQANPIPMELLNVNKNNGQSFGYIVYRKVNVNIPAGGVLLIEGRVCDTVMVLVNGKLVSPPLEKTSDFSKFGTSKVENSSLVLTNVPLSNATIDLIVENWGRINVAVYVAFKGLWQGGVKLNGAYLHDWLIYPLEFKKSWTNSLNHWSSYNKQLTGPVIYKATLQIKETPKDTFVHMENWVKGIVIVNGFVLGRYARIGPIQTLYLPAPFLKTGSNEIVVFEHFQSSQNIQFVKNHIYKSH